MKPYYEEAGITIYHGDCREIDVWENADVLISDPPYGISWSRGSNPKRASKPHEGILNDEDTSCRDYVIERFVPKPCAFFGSFYASFPAFLTQVLVWHKPADAGVVGSTTGFRRDVEPVFLVGTWPKREVRWPSVIRSHRNSIKQIACETGHPHTKPVDVIEQIAKLFGGVIVDPFLGSGSTLVAAKNLGRSAIGIELEEKYCEIAANRLRQSVLNFERAVETCI